MSESAGGVTELGALIAQFGIGGAFAALLFWFYRRDMRSYADLWQTQANENRAMVDRVIALVETTIRTNTELAGAVSALHRRLDGDHPP